MSKLLSMMMAKGSGGVEFKTSIYTTGNAYINTHLANIDGYIIDVEVLDYPTSSGSTSNYVVGALTGSGESRIGNEINITYHPSFNSIFVCNYFNNSYANVVNYVSLNTKPQTVSLQCLNITTATPSELDVFVFAGNVNGSAMYFCNVIKIKNLQLFSGNTKVADLKPAIVNGESGMYDTVGQQFCGNANSVGSLVCE